jgi:hypothetical protein
LFSFSSSFFLSFFLFSARALTVGKRFSCHHMWRWWVWGDPGRGLSEVCAVSADNHPTISLADMGFSVFSLLSHYLTFSFYSLPPPLPPFVSGLLSFWMASSHLKLLLLYSSNCNLVNRFLHTRLLSCFTQK